MWFLYVNLTRYYWVYIGHAEQITLNASTRCSYDSTFSQSTIVPQDFITWSHASFGWTIILHFALTFLSMWKRHNKLAALGNTTFVAFIRAISLSLTTTFGYEATLKNKHLNFSKAYTKLWWSSNLSNINLALKVNLVEVTSTTSNKGILYLLILYVLSIINTMLKAFNNFTESGCVQNKSCTTFVPS